MSRRIQQMRPVDIDPTPPGDIEAQLKAQLRGLADVRMPHECDEPILAAPVRRAVYEWMTETRMRSELKAVGVNPRHTCLLYGPPGCGKTTLAHHFAARLGMPLIIATCDQLVDMYLGASGKNIRALFDTLRMYDGKVVGFMDEFDAIAGKRQSGKDPGGAGSERNAIVAALLTNIESLTGLFFAATNRSDALDPAIWRRFGMQLDVELPEFDERFAIIKRYFEPFECDQSVLDALALITDGAAPSLLRQLVEGVKRALVLGPKLKRPTDDPIAVVGSVVAQVAPHPDYLQPPFRIPALWSDKSEISLLHGKPWPPKRRSA